MFHQLGHKVHSNGAECEAPRHIQPLWHHSPDSPQSAVMCWVNFAGHHCGVPTYPTPHSRACLSVQYSIVCLTYMSNPSATPVPVEDPRSMLPSHPTSHSTQYSLGLPPIGQGIGQQHRGVAPLGEALEYCLSNWPVSLLEF